ncbi:MAG: hypothetical protein ACYCOU_02535 [Sulfobacillus sp.]
MKTHSRSRRALVVFVLGATLLTSGTVQGNSRDARRFLAFSSFTSSPLMTIQTTPRTQVVGTDFLSAGSRVRMVGSLKGQVFWATRIEPID